MFDPAVGLAVGLNTLPKTTHLSGYSHRVERSSNRLLLAAPAGRLVELGLVTVRHSGFNLDFHAIRHHGDDPPLEKNYVPSMCASLGVARRSDPKCCTIYTAPSELLGRASGHLRTVIAYG